MEPLSRNLRVTLAIAFTIALVLRLAFASVLVPDGLGDDGYITLSRTGYHTAPNRGSDTLIHHAFVIPSEDFDAACAHVEASGVEVKLYEDTGHRSFPGRHLYFHDPDGNAIEFIDLQGESNDDAPAYEGRARRRAKAHLAG